ncbi:MAG TPA: response regulator [Phototrophicaceae bacterium]|jgi:pilus assembly protein CpaE|nr:response regulator [Phototrophicaceae bacterium]
MPEKILVVDDDLDSLKLIGLMLQRQGYEVIAGSTGSQALSRANSEHPDLIILDVMMPDMNGYEVCKRLRNNPDTQSIPIIMFTAKTLIDDKVAGFEAGADDYLTKPTHPAELSARVKQILARNSHRTPRESSRGSSIGVLGAKGGLGTTTIALNIATSLAQSGAKSIVADFRPGAGSMGLMLGIEKATGMANALSRPAGELRPAALEKELVVHASGLRALLCSTRPREAQVNYQIESAEAIVQSLKSLGNPAIFDLGTGYTALNSHLLAAMDRILLVVEPNSMTLKIGLNILRELETELKKMVNIVVMTTTQSKAQMPWHEVEAMLGREILAIISSAPELAFQAVESATPLVLLQPNSIVSSQLIRLAADIKA